MNPTCDDCGSDKDLVTFHCAPCLERLLVERERVNGDRNEVLTKPQYLAFVASEVAAGRMKARR